MHFVKAKGILSAANGMNLYRGCTHGCIYCDSRSKCYQMAHPFEDIEVKENALTLLENALKRKRVKCMLGTGAMSDPYLALEEELGYTRQALQIAYRYGFGFTLLTKSARVLRDLELLQAINERSKCVVQMTLTTADETLCRLLEPNVSTSKERIRALHQLHAAGIPTVVWLCPILPFINDTKENIEAILQSCAQAKVFGVICFGMGVTLREGNRDYFYQQLDRHFPGMKERYMRTYGLRYECNSLHHTALMRLFHERCEAYGLIHDNRQIFHYLSTLPQKQSAIQPTLFE